MAKKTVSAVCYFLIAAAFTWYFYSHRSDLAQIRVVALWPVIPISVATIFALLVNGTISFLILRKLGCSIGFGESQSIAVINTAMNTLVMGQAGTAARAVYLKRFYNLDYGKYLASIAASNFPRLFVCALISLLPGLVYREISSSPILQLAFVGAITLCIGAWVFPFFPASKLPKRFSSSKIQVISMAWKKICMDSGVLFKLIFLCLLSVGADSVLIWSSYELIGLHVGWLLCFFLASLGMVSAIFSITPGGIGVYEATIAYLGSLFGIASLSTVLAAMVGRIALIIYLAVFTPVSLLLLAKRRRTKVEAWPLQKEKIRASQR